MDLNEYISPSLAALVPILYICGIAIKKSSIADYKIPFILGGIGIVLANIWLFAADILSGWQDALTKLLSGTMQGIICAACSVYTKNIVKQYGKRTDGGKDGNGGDA